MMKNFKAGALALAGAFALLGAGAVFGQTDVEAEVAEREAGKAGKIGLTFGFGVNFGNVVLQEGEKYAFFNNKNGDGRGSIILPDVVFAKDIGKWFVEAEMKLAIANSYALGTAVAQASGNVRFKAPGYGLHDDSHLTVAYNASDKLRLFTVIGDSSIVRPGVSYFFIQQVGGQLDLIFTKGAALDSVVPGINIFHAGPADFQFLLRPRVNLKFGSFSGYVRADILCFNSGYEMAVDDDGFVKTKNDLEGDQVFRNVKLFGSQNIGDLYWEAAVVIPTYKDGIKSAGVTISPKVAYTIKDAITPYFSFDLTGLGKEKYGDEKVIGFVPEIGLAYSF